ncbi:MAG: hypothetical protein ACR2QM_20985 [Longimicrobiales bacterium]
MNIRKTILTGAVSAGLLVACDSDPFQLQWEASADTVSLFALSRPELNLTSAFDFFGRQPLRLEAPTTGDEWDVAVDTRDGGFVWLPALSLGVPSDAGFARLEGQTFLQAIEAPADTSLYVTDAPVPVQVGQVFAVRTRLVPGPFGSQCNYFGKVEAIAADVTQGRLTFRFDVSPICNDRDLIPPN